MVALPCEHITEIMCSAEVVRFMGTVMTLYSRTSDKYTEDTLRTDVIKEMKLLRKACGGDEKPYMSAVLCATVYKQLWG